MVTKPITASGPQPSQPGENQSNLIAVGAGTAAISALGFVPTKRGRLWDNYLNAIRATESGFPGGVLKTFRISEYLSVLESWERGSVNSSLLDFGGDYADFMRVTFGPNIKELSVTKTSALFGDISSDGRKLGLALQIESGTQKGASISDYYARLSGMKLGVTDSLSDSILLSEYRDLELDISFNEWKSSLTPIQKKRSLLLGAKFRESIKIAGKEINLSAGQQRLVAKTEIMSKLMRAKAASTAGRLNNLLTKPFEIPIVGDILHKIPIVKSIGIEPGSATKMMGRYVKKGLVLGAAYKGLSYYDYLRAEGGTASVGVSLLGGATLGGLLLTRPGVRFNKTNALIGAAAGLYTALSPRFDEGLFSGFGSMFADANIARAQMSTTSSVSDSLRRQEEITPGLISAKTALGFAGAGSLTVGMGEYGRFLYKAGIEKYKTKAPLGEIFDTTRQMMKEHYGDFWKTKVGKTVAKIPKLGKYISKVKNPFALGAIAGLAAWTGLSSGVSLLSGNIAAATPGLNLLASSDDPDQLKRIYSGEEDVAIRKGRWWEMGRSTAYEGGKIEYYRPHALARLRTRAYEKGIYGSEEEKWAHDPMLHPLQALFGSEEWKYHYDTKNAQSRPAPLSSTYGDDIPFIGPLISSTIGKLLKPRKAIRQDEWDLGNGEYVHRPDPRRETEPSYELGGLRPGAPVAPDDPSQLLNELNYRRREAVGLVGFAESAIQKSITGREEVFSNKQTFDVMGKETGAEYWLWSHLNVGGALGSSEVVRRFIPHTRSYLDQYNPLKNDLPSWLPDDYFTDLKHGNPFSKVKEAEIRLPGEGYAALNPEVQGIDPEKYPLMHRLKILGDVAMYSKEYRSTLKQAKTRRSEMSDQDRSLLERIEAQVKSKKINKEFQETRFDSSQLSSREVTVTDVLSPTRIKTKELGDMTVELQGIGKIANLNEAIRFTKDRLLGEQIKIVTPSSQSRGIDMTASGGRQKAVALLDDNDYGQILSEAGLAERGHLKDEFEQIGFSKREQLAGALSESVLHNIEAPFEKLTPFSPTAKLIRQRTALEDYIRTQAVSTSNAFWDKPLENFVQPTQETAEYMLGDESIPENIKQRRKIQEYFDMLKWAKAQKNNNPYQKSKTMFGIDAYSSPQLIMKALPRNERDYFPAFSEAKSDEERQKILNFIPENERRLYKAAWLRKEEEASFAKESAGIADDRDEEVLSAGQMARKSEGFEISPDLWEQWQEETNEEVPYDEWIRMKKAKEYFSTHSLPGADWLAWRSDVDLEDVKLKYVENAGLDHHDFDLWGDRLKALARKPYIDQEMIAQLEDADNLTEEQRVHTASDNLTRLFSDGSTEGSFYTRQIDANIDSSYNIEIQDGRQEIIAETYKNMGIR